MATYTQLRRLAEICRVDGEKAPVTPDDLDALLDIAEARSTDDDEEELIPTSLVSM